MAIANTMLLLFTANALKLNNVILASKTLAVAGLEVPCKILPDQKSIRSGPVDHPCQESTVVCLSLHSSP